METPTGIILPDLSCAYVLCLVLLFFFLVDDRVTRNSTLLTDVTEHTSMIRTGYDMYRNRNVLKTNSKFKHFQQRSQEETPG